MNRGFVLAGLIALSGCAGYAPNGTLVGQSQQVVIDSMGQPGRTQDRYVDYMRGPYGVHTYRLYFDHQNRLLRWEQLLTEDQFLKVREGMTQTQVIDLLGVSTVISELGRGRGEVWSYRYENPLCQWFQIEFDPSGLVRSAGYGIPPECDNNDSDIEAQ
jgi:hypothetical protein